MKNPFLVAFYNFFAPGLGYVVLQKRLVFGWLLLFVSIAGYVLTFAVPQPATEVTSLDLAGFVLSLITSFAFAYDAYQLAKER